MVVSRRLFVVVRRVRSLWAVVGYWLLLSSSLHAGCCLLPLMFALVACRCSLLCDVIPCKCCLLCVGFRLLIVDVACRLLLCVVYCCRGGCCWF